MSRPLNNIGINTNVGEWRRAVSPNGDLNKMKRSISPMPDSLSSPSDSGSTRQQTKYARKPLSSTLSTGAGQNVAALQQHHKALMQQQDASAIDPRKLSSTPTGYRSVSPIPNFNRTKSNENINIRQKSRSNSVNQEDDVIFDDSMEAEDMGDDIEDERMVIIQDTRARSSSISRGSGGSIMSTQQSSNFYPMNHSPPQEFKVVKEGWLFRKTVMQQWKRVYAVAKHGNAVKPGGLYLYKDMKCTAHIQTYDMSEVLEISPRAKEFKQGSKYEILMRVKRENVTLGTDDIQTRKDWIDSLTSIMGKVSIATQNELTSRIHSSEQMNRDLQELLEELDAENNQLKQELQTIKENHSKKDRFHQQELQNRDNELREAFAKKERQFEQELREREESMMTEMDRQRQALETKVEIFEREAVQWRSKYSDLESRKMMMDGEDKYRHKIETLEIELRKWKNRVDELEHQNKQIDYRNISGSAYSSRHTATGSFEAVSNEGVKELMTDVKFNLQLLKDHIKSPSDEPLLDIKKSIDTLHETLESAKLGWTELQGDIVKFLDTEKEELDKKDTNQTQLIESLKEEFSDLRQELTGISNEEETANKSPSLSEKFDLLLQMIENVQLSQSRLSTSFLEQTRSSSSSSDSSRPTTPVSETQKDSDIYKAVMLHQQQLSELIKESREHHESTITTIESSLRSRKSLSAEPADLGRSCDKITKIVKNAMDDIDIRQQQAQEEQSKHIKAIGNLLKLISADIQASSIPDMAALSQQLEDVVERLNTTEERLSMLNFSSRSEPDQNNGSVSFRNLASSASNTMGDDKNNSQLYGFLQNTEKLIEHTLKVLNKHDGMEETIRRAVKNVSKDQLEEIRHIHEENKDERTVMEGKMQRYEENARVYFERSMDKVHNELQEISGVLYNMVEEFVLKALEYIPNSGIAPNRGDGQSESQSRASIENLIELHGKLSGLNLALKSEITKLQEEKEKLETNVKKMQKTSKDLERELDQRHEELRSIQIDYERAQKDVQRARQEATSNLARELEPLINQISRLRKMSEVQSASNNDDHDYSNLERESRSKNNQTRSNQDRRYNGRDLSNSSSYDLDLNDDDDEKPENTNSKLRFPTFMNRNRRGSFTSQTSDGNEQSYSSDQQPIKSPLIGSRERPRLKSPHSSYLGRK